MNLAVSSGLQIQLGNICGAKRSASKQFVDCIFACADGETQYRILEWIKPN